MAEVLALQLRLQSGWTETETARPYHSHIYGLRITVRLLSNAGPASRARGLCRMARPEPGTGDARARGELFGRRGEVDVVLVEHLDRLCRHLADGATIHDGLKVAGVRLVRTRRKNRRCRPCTPRWRTWSTDRRCNLRPRCSSRTGGARIRPAGVTRLY